MPTGPDPSPFVSPYRILNEQEPYRPNSDPFFGTDGASRVVRDNPEKVREAAGAIAAAIDADLVRQMKAEQQDRIESKLDELLRLLDPGAIKVYRKMP